MSYIFFAVLVTVLSLCGLWVAKTMRHAEDLRTAERRQQRSRDDQQDELNTRGMSGTIRTASIVLLIGGNLLVAGFSSFYQVPAGSLGIVYNFGAIDGQTGEGPQFVLPWKSVYPASTQVQSKFYEKLDSFSSETQNVFVAATVNFHVSPENIQKLYRTVGPNYAAVLIDPRVYQDFKDATVQYTSVDIAPHREDIRKAVADRITKELQAQSIIVDDVLVNNISFSKEFEAAIENKQIQSQNALAEAQKVAAEHQKALQAVEVATGAANSAFIKAQKEAQANDVLTKSVTPELIQYLTVQKLSPNVSVMMIPTGSQFILGSDLIGAAKLKQ